MGADIARGVGLALALWLPGGLVLGMLCALDVIDGLIALAALSAVFVIAGLSAVFLIASTARARAMIERLGPAETDGSGQPGFPVRAVWPEVLRLRRAWQEDA